MRTARSGAPVKATPCGRRRGHTHDVPNADPASVPPTPTQADVAAALRVMKPLRKLIKPKVYGIDNVPTKRALLVGNHNTLGLVDAPLLAAELWERGRMVRSLGDHAHFKIPGWRDALTQLGVVEGTREIASELMRRGELVMVFPGGGREVNKRKNERYKLVWKNRLGFARLAIKHGYPIVPFASVGAEHGIDILLDNESPLMAPVQFLAEKLLGTPDGPPLVRGIGLTPVPRPERQYYWFGEPIGTTEFTGRDDDDNAARKVRERAAAAIEEGIQLMLAERDADPNRSVVGRLLRPDA
ncbi:acyltransferase family protein [Mycobacterium shinjukuense]|uniref:lysophospholipid acyltransferase family protein n=1 Tax=Mycobacterium shinjukuense TaxID=398694 RepID=UPI0009F4EF41|nr:lysophospholipid acyltransferase family protein [Mycobacterium shinjukuense]MCV6986608.1 acyltransferase family protein [Mycobacterium shinjukuense]